MPNAKRLPSYPDGERAVLACCLFDNGCVPSVLNALEASDFYASRHAVIFEAIRNLSTQGSPIDLVTLPQFLEKQGTLDEVGGIPGITELVEGASSAANVSHYITIIREKAALRRMIRATEEVQRAAFAHDASVQDIQERLQKAAFESALQSERFRGLIQLHQLLPSTLKMLREARNRGISSGFSSIDAITNGFRPEQLIVVGGRPSMGKSAFALDVAVSAARTVPVAIFNLEMSAEDLATRLIAKRSDVDLHNIRAGHVASVEWKAIAQASGALSDYPIFFDDSGDISPVRIKARIRELTLRTGLMPGLIIVDYLQLMRADGKFNSRNDYIGSITRDLKLLARELQIPVILLSQLNRKLEERPFKDHQRRPQMADFRDSGSIEQDADIICAIYRPEVYSDDSKYRGLAEVAILKNRNGRIGRARLVWFRETASFRDLESVSRVQLEAI